MAKARVKNVWDHNFAKSPEIRERVKQIYQGKMRRCRDNRNQLEDEWMKFYNMWNVSHDEHHTYNGRAKLYLPEVRKNVESQARQLTEAAFPNEDFFDVSPGLTGTKVGARTWKSIMRHNIEKSQLRVKYHVFQRQNCMMGTSPAALVWDKQTERVFRSAFDKKSKKIKPTRQLVELYNGPNFITRDLFRWFAFNPKRDDLRDGCFEDVVASYFDLLAMDKEGLLVGLKDIEKGPSDAYAMEQLERDIERAEKIGLTIGNQGYAGEAVLNDKESAGDRTYVVTTIYDRMVAPEMCEEDEDPALPIPVQIKMVNGEHVVLVRRNPFFHQRPPYVVGKYILPNADEFYGQGIPWAIQYMQLEANSKLEQAMDSATLALNPLAFIDPALASQMSDFNVEPGATWFVSPNGVKFGSIPDVTPTAYAAVSQLRAQMADFSDRSPALPPQLLGKSRTATQSEIVSNSLSIDNKAFALQNEIMVLQPMLEQWEYLIDQNITEDQLVMILGRRASDWKRVKVSKHQTLGSYMYFWKTVSTLQNKPIQARQMLDFFKIVSTLPPEAQKQLRFQWAEAAKTLWSELWNMPDSDKMFGAPEEMESQDTGTEHQMLEVGLNLEVLPGDDDKEHMTSHDEEIKRLKDAKETILAERLIEHNLEHAEQLKKKIEIAQKAQAMQQQMLAMAMAQQQQQGQGGARRSPGSGNRTQLSPNANSGDMGSGVRA
jgi:hypothetical protein